MDASQEDSLFHFREAMSPPTFVYGHENIT